MYCMIARNQIKPGKMDAVAKTFEKDIVPIMKKIPGFRATHMVMGPKGEYTVFILWDNRSSADAYANSPDRKTALEATADLFESPMKLEFGEIRYSTKA